MNSHYYAFRFDAKPNIFRYNTIDKICEIINSRYNNSSLEISFSHKLYSIPNHFNFENTFSVDFIFDNPSTPLENSQSNEDHTKAKESWDENEVSEPKYMHL